MGKWIRLRLPLTQPAKINPCSHSDGGASDAMFPFTTPAFSGSVRWRSRLTARSASAGRTRARMTGTSRGSGQETGRLKEDTRDAHVEKQRQPDPTPGEPSTRKSSHLHRYLASAVRGSAKTCPPGILICSLLSAVKISFGQSTFV